MFGLPIFRRRTPVGSETPKDCSDLYGCKPQEPRVLKSALRLAQMVLNHYSLIVSADWKHLATWGSTPGTDTYGTTTGRTGVTSTSNKPQTSIINWKDEPKSIIKVFSYGYDNFTIFRTENNELYGTGNNVNYVLNKSSTGVQNAFNLIVDNVIDFCASGSIYLLYVKTNGKVYGLGPSNVGFGFPATNQRNLTIDDGSESNYLGISAAIKVFTTSPENQSKSFVLLMDGTVMACGYNTDGCLGVNKSDSIVYEWTKVKKTNDGGSTFVDLDNVIDIVTTNYVLSGGAGGAGDTWAGVSGSHHMSTYFLCSDGSVYTCGNNIYGQLGLNISTNQTKIYAAKTSILNASQMCTTAGGTSILVTTTDDKVYTWGNNQWGQLGLGDTTNRLMPTQVIFPLKKIKMIHGGGMYGIINGAFLVVCNDGTIYGAGYNKTYALGITTSGIPNPGPIMTFTRNEFFGYNPTQNQDSQRYPIIVTGTTTLGSNTITNAVLSVNKTVFGSTETVYIKPGMIISGPGIQPNTEVRLIDPIRNEIIMSLSATSTASSITLQYDNIIKVYQADLCGYGTEMAQKVVSEDGTLYMSGWNQNVNNIWNFNYYYGSQNVSIPTVFDAKFS